MCVRSSGYPYTAGVKILAIAHDVRVCVVGRSQPIQLNIGLRVIRV